MKSLELALLVSSAPWSPPLLQDTRGRCTRPERFFHCYNIKSIHRNSYSPLLSESPGQSEFQEILLLLQRRQRSHALTRDLENGMAGALVLVTLVQAQRVVARAKSALMRHLTPRRLRTDLSEPLQEPNPLLFSSKLSTLTLYTV